MFDHLLELSRGDNSNKWSNIGFGEEIGIIEIKMHTLSGSLQQNRISVTLLIEGKFNINTVNP